MTKPSARPSLPRRLAFAALTACATLAPLALAAELHLRRLAAAERPGVLAPHQRRHGLPVNGRTRSLKPGLDYVQVPGFGEIEGATVNSWGFHDAEPMLPRPPSTFGVAVIGDSMTYGTHVAWDQAWPAVLERRLTAPAPLGSIDVTNLGVSGYQLTEIEAAAREVALPLFAPDLLIYAAYSNDVSDMGLNQYRYQQRFPEACTSPESSDEVVPSFWLFPERLERWLRTRSSLVAELRFRRDLLRYDVLLPALERARERGGALATAARGLERAVPFFDPHLEICRRFRYGFVLLEAIAEVARERGVPLVIVEIPNLEHLDRGDPGSMHSFLASFAESHPDVPFVEPRTAIREEAARRGVPARDLYLGDADFHPTPLGHELLAAALAAPIQREVERAAQRRARRAASP
ncbi:MAG: SGNH/GDSL hydrolase family protein [Deltaproteobacteria bacterium]|nr:SGNH/GDSL hydrolase family protein [Deltaproteobacteria bacterium]